MTPGSPGPWRGQLCCCCLVTQPCLTLFDPVDCSPPGSSVHGDSPGKNTGVSCHFLLQGIFLTQRLNPHLLHWQAESLPMCHQVSPSDGDGAPLMNVVLHHTGAPKLQQIHSQRVLGGQCFHPTFDLETCVALENCNLGRRKINFFSLYSNSTSFIFHWRNECRIDWSPLGTIQEHFPITRHFDDEHNGESSVFLQLLCLPVNNHNSNNECFIQQVSGVSADCEDELCITLGASWWAPPITAVCRELEHSLFETSLSSSWLWWGQCRFSLARFLELDSILLLSGKTLKILFTYAFGLLGVFFVFGYRRQWSGMCSKIFFSKKYLFIQLCWARHAGSLISVVICKGLPRGSAVKNLPAVQDVQETRVRSLGREDPLEEGVATHPTILLWRVPWTEEPGGLQSIGLQSQTRLKRLCMHACDLQTLSCGMWDLVPWSGIKP